MARLDSTEVARFHQLLSRLVSAGVALPPALEQLGEDLDGRLRDTALALSKELAEGRSLGEALAARDDMPRLYAEMIAATEGGGEGSSTTLAEVLGHVARHAAVSARIRRQVSDALMYPLLLAGAAVLLFFYISTELAADVQVFGSALRQGNGRILGASGTMPESSSLLATLSVFGSVAALVGAAVAVRLGRVPSWGYRVPLIGAALRGGEIAAVLRTLALLVSAGRRPERALGLAAETTSWPALNRGAGDAARALEAGEPFAPAMEKFGALPGELRWLLVGAWKQGEDFPSAAAEVADAAEAEASEQARRAAVSVEVIVLGLGGLAVLAVGVMTYIRLNSLVDFLSVVN